MGYPVIFKYAEVRPITTDEGKLYESMKVAMPAIEYGNTVVYDFYTTLWEWAGGDHQDVTPKMHCAIVRYESMPLYKDKKSLKCEIKFSEHYTQKLRNGEILSGARDAIHMLYDSNDKLLELRHGDIDGDGDEDIAIKLASGGTYVFINETHDTNGLPISL